MIKVSVIMHTIKKTPKITETMVAVLLGFALIAAPKVHPRKKDHECEAYKNCRVDFMTHD
ncbi:hypothetical protein AC418_14160 [Salmonella enterica]|uniref:hypothetical protein n=1 Tax=Salmonella enterica TaxID=28901 RepID=UPI0009AC6746|nr:hypothetical protein [Salmonella enterica]EBP7228019.1 hypothetical protein [Salmonella enterica subsp. enterica]ECK7216297.1 hypothetical protein [Salmonella enterica subsp. enterica serovar Guinea]EDB4568803.1 hypothetical protein [Salmonella enterica subsp. enterica serovar Panama]EDU0261319.1 hypothetical protein [Salmonella enterica subsp. enterica serovar Kiambu]EAB2878412.1 hypothetical protein [Salmonella enterica]